MIRYLISRLTTIPINPKEVPKVDLRVPERLERLPQQVKREPPQLRPLLGIIRPEVAHCF